MQMQNRTDSSSSCETEKPAVSRSRSLILISIRDSNNADELYNRITDTMRKPQIYFILEARVSPCLVIVTAYPKKGRHT
jgi:hypothetical protein